MRRVWLAFVTAVLTTCQPASSEGVSWPPVQCDDVMCDPGELCVVPGKVCVPLDDTDSDGCNSDTPECYDDEPGPSPFCAAVPESCGNDPSRSCLGETYCEGGGCGHHVFSEGVLECGAAFCHCP
jgi:hypothetical protein